MSVTAVVGVHFGDEGKGKVIDHLAAAANVTVRYNGGANAGHTLVNKWGTFRLHLVPSGIFTPGCTCIVGPGTVIDPAALLTEIDEITTAGISVDHLWISNRAHVVMPYHKILDALEEEARGARVQGTTRRGIGPAYADKVGRSGVRIGDLLDETTCRDVVGYAVEQKNRVITRLYDGTPLNGEEIIGQALAWGNALRARITDVTPLLARSLAADESILLEGQLGMMRDLDWGIYPYVTSSSAGPGGAAVGAGIPPWRISRVVGVCKAITSSVGEGPFPTELTNDLADRLRRAGPQAGWEFGASTGRPRRIGWFDGVALRYAVTVFGVTELAVLKIDVLDGFETVRLCTGYTLDGQPVASMPLTSELGRVQPTYEELPGWNGPTSTARTWNDLPPQARAYLDRISQLAGVPVTLIGIGPGREEMISRVN